MNYVVNALEINQLITRGPHNWFLTYCSPGVSFMDGTFSRFRINKKDPKTIQHDNKAYFVTFFL